MGVFESRPREDDMRGPGKGIWLSVAVQSVVRDSGASRHFGTVLRRPWKLDCPVFASLVTIAR